MNTVTQADTKPVDMMTTTISVPRDLWARARAAATKHATSAQKLCEEGLELRLTQLDENEGAGRAPTKKSGR